VSEGQSNSSATLHPFFEHLVRPSSSNHWFIAPDWFPGLPDETAPEYTVPVERLRAVFDEAIGSLKGVRVKKRDGALTHYIAQTAIFHFKDDIRVQFLPLSPETSSLAAYSASRIGFGDLGANRKRLRHWLGLLGDRLA